MALRVGATGQLSAKVRTQSRHALLASSAIAGGILAGFFAIPQSVLAACSTTGTTTVTLTCAANTTTTPTTNSTSPNASTSDQTQQFGANIVGDIDPGVMVDGRGLSIKATGGGHTIDVINDGTVTTASGTAALAITGDGGLVTYNGNGDVTSTNTATAGLRIFNLTGPGGVNIGTAGAPVTGNFTGSDAIGIGTADALGGGALGNVNVYLNGGSLTATGSSGYGLLIHSAGSGTVNAMLTGNTTITPGPGNVSGAGIEFIDSLAGSSFQASFDSNIGTASNRFNTGFGASISSGSVDVTQTGGTIYASSAGIAIGTNSLSGRGILIVRTLAGSRIDSSNTGISVSNVARAGGTQLMIGGSIVAPIGIRASGGGITVNISDTGSISASTTGLDLSSSFGLLNFGSISVFNAGSISAASIGINMSGNAPESITNSGTISGATAIRFGNSLVGGSIFNTLTLLAGSTITGTVLGGTGIDKLVLGGSTDATFDIGAVGAAAQYRNFELFEKSGTSNWTLTGITTFAGPTAVNAGVLTVNGDISASSSVTVDSGATLMGTGTVSTATIKSGATLMPGTLGAPALGHSIGTLSVQGNLTFETGSVYAVEVSPSAADRTNVTGTATLAGTVRAYFDYGSLAQHYTILHSAGGLSGTFDDFTTTNVPPNFIAGLSYTGTDVLLNLTASLGRSDNLPPNQQNVANALNNYFNNGGTLPPAFVYLYGLTGNNLYTALSQISGEAGAGGGARAGMQMTNSFMSLLLNPFGGLPDGNIGGVGGSRGFGFAAEQGPSPQAARAFAAVTPKDRLSTAAFDRRWGFWSAAYGGYNKTGGDAAIGSHDTTARSYGFATGADYRTSPDLIIGFALAGGGLNYGLSAGLGGGRSDVFQVGVYGSKQFGSSYISAALSYAWHQMTTNRTVTVSGTDILTANFKANNFGGRIEAGHRFTTPLLGITPYAALQAQMFRIPSYSETATSGSSAFALSYDAKSTTITRTELGIWLDKMIVLDRGNALAIRTRAAWAHDRSSDESVRAAFQTLPGSNFTVNGAATVPDSALLSAGAEVRLASGISFGAKFDGEFASRSQSYAGTGMVRYTW